MRRFSFLVLLVLLLLVAAGCGSASTPAPSTGGSAAPSSVASPSPSTSPSASPTAQASAPPPATSAPSVMGLDEWSSAQLFLLAGAEPEIRPTCAKAPQLPEGAYDGILCAPAELGSIGYYAFEDRDAMRRLYFSRLEEHKVGPNTGEGCFDAPGEGADTPGNEGFELRVGCYVDETGLANARMLFPGEVVGQSVYVGAVGTDGSIANLFAALFPDFEPGSTGCGWCIGGIWSQPGEFH